MKWNDLRDALRARGAIHEDRTDSGDRHVTVTGVAYDSRTVKPGNVFVALKGLHADGTTFVHQAMDRGAVAIVSEDPPAEQTRVSWTQVHDARLALAQLAAAFYRHPSGEMQVIGVTGTNGKTTTAYLIASIFEAAGIPCGVVGTVAYRIGREVREATRTTPEAPEVQSLLREMVDRGAAACAMEVSSHALSLRRVDEISFAAAVFTNLTRDHLDFHTDMEDYFRAKRRLFEMLPPGKPSLVNVDDPRGLSLAGIVRRPVTFAVDRPADITPGPLSYSLAGLAFDVRTPRGALRLRSTLVGRPNVYNILAASATGVALDLPFDAIEAGVRAVRGVPGRFEIVSGEKDGVTVVVDYAHTDDALRNLLETARSLATGRLITVFGCGGDRDRTKRPLMGAVASRLSDLTIITSDNPRGEDPDRIIEDIRRGITPDSGGWPLSKAAESGGRDSAQRVLAIADRHEAIDKAIELARPNDLVLVAGKGHEKYQIVGDRVLPFDDVTVAREALARRRASSGVA
ncbi:MAG TPA: UDP-N-acetylmuramoyl-L-alanyl-D-glutamate--2,6-diaminopimelate ligase [Vicinamibacterales bacterium]|nr:UDP-N-acetylmuramoyl-L-alanyl-D-glutamate--2,6-diaminopimelate ligase [Vicinamibacterales bacterium]